MQNNPRPPDVALLRLLQDTESQLAGASGLWQRRLDEAQAEWGRALAEAEAAAEARVAAVVRDAEGRLVDEGREVERRLRDCEAGWRGKLAELEAAWGERRAAAARTRACIMHAHMHQGWCSSMQQAALVLQILTHAHALGRRRALRG